MVPRGRVLPMFRICEWPKTFAQGPAHRTHKRLVRVFFEKFLEPLNFDWTVHPEKVWVVANGFHKGYIVRFFNRDIGERLSGQRILRSCAEEILFSVP